MYERILIPLDGSEEAEAAVHEVVHLSVNPKIIHLQLVESGVMQSRQLEGYTLYSDQIHDARTRSGEAYVQPLRRKLEDRGLRVEVSITNGAPLHEVANRAKKLEADLILIGAGEEGMAGTPLWIGASRPASCEKTEHPCPAGSKAGAGATERGSTKSRIEYPAVAQPMGRAPTYLPLGGPRHPAKGHREGNPHFPSFRVVPKLSPGW